MDEDTQPLLDKHLEQIKKQQDKVFEWAREASDSIFSLARYTYSHWYDAITYRSYVIQLLERTGGETTFTKEEFLHHEEKYVGKVVRIEHVDNEDGSITIRTKIIEEETKEET